MRQHRGLNTLPLQQAKEWERFPFAAAFQPIASHVEQTTPVNAVVHFPSCPRIDASLKAAEDSWRCTVSMNFPYQSGARFSGIRNQAPSSEPVRHQSTSSHRSSSDIRRRGLVPDARIVRLCQHPHPPRNDEEPRLYQQQKGSWIGVLGRELLTPRRRSTLAAPASGFFRLLQFCDETELKLGFFLLSRCRWRYPIHLYRTAFECAQRPAAISRLHPLTSTKRR